MTTTNMKLRRPEHENTNTWGIKAFLDAGFSHFQICTTPRAIVRGMAVKGDVVIPLNHRQCDAVENSTLLTAGATADPTIWIYVPNGGE